MLRSLINTDKRTTREPIRGGKAQNYTINNDTNDGLGDMGANGSFMPAT